MPRMLLRQRLTSFAFIAIFVILAFLGRSRGEDEFDSIKQEIFLAKREGRVEDIMKLHRALKDGIDRRYQEQLAQQPQVKGVTDSRSSSSRRRGLSDRPDRPERRRINRELDYEEQRNAHFGEELDDRYQHPRDDSRIRRQRGDQLQKNDPLLQGLSDERALYHMEQSHKKASILTHKLSKGEGFFSMEEQMSYKNMIQRFLELEKVVATYLQKTSEDYARARTITDKEERSKYLESVKAAWDLRKPQEKMARDAARESFLQIKKALEGHLQARSIAMGQGEL